MAACGHREQKYLLLTNQVPGSPCDTKNLTLKQEDSWNKAFPSPPPPPPQILHLEDCTVLPGVWL